MNPDKHRVIGHTRTLRFFPDDGQFRWCEFFTIWTPQGVITRDTVDPQPAGSRRGKNLYIKVNGKTRTLSHVAYENHHKVRLPLHARIRHIDGDIWNNRKDNLQLVPRGGHQAITRIAGKVVYVGTYPTKEEAVAAVTAARAAVGMNPVKPRNRNLKEN